MLSDRGNRWGKLAFSLGSSGYCRRAYGIFLKLGHMGSGVSGFRLVA